MWRMVPAWLVAIRGRVPSGPAFVLGALPIALALVAWGLLTWGPVEERSISPTILPSPAEVLRSVPDLVARRDQEGRGLAGHVALSVQRVGEGYLVALAAVLPLGVLMGAFGSVRATFAPVMTASGYIPIATLVPLTMSWFGTGEEQKVMFLAMAFAIYLLPLVVQAIEAVPDVYLRTAYTLGTSRWQAIWRVLVPVALPDLWQAMRLAFGVGWTYLVLAEVIVLTGGLGNLIEIARRRGPREHIYLAIVIITVIAWIVDEIWDRLGRILFPYRRERA
jgi:NitT/TauT family transport system permease protein